jgi:predicted transcriptional regulator
MTINLENLEIPEAPEAPIGKCQRIRDAFADGCQTVADVTERMAELGVAVAPATISTQVNKLRREAGLSTGRRERTGAVRAIREAFEADPDNVTKADVLEALDAQGIEVSLNTVNTQLSRLRKEFGISAPGNRGRGVCAAIRALFDNGVTTVSHMTKALEANGIEASPATVKTQVGKLRSAAKRAA